MAAPESLAGRARARSRMEAAIGGSGYRQRRAAHESSGVLADRPRQNYDGGGAGQIAPLAQRDGLTVQGPTVRLCCRGLALLSGVTGLSGSRGAPGGAVRLRRTRRGAGNMGPVQGVGCG